MLLNIESVKPTAKSLILKAGGKEYFAKKDSGISAGMTIDAEVKDSDFNGKTYTWVGKWRPAVQENSGTASAAKDNNILLPYMPFVSNVVAHAISAGIITAPNMIESWAMAAYSAARKLETDVPF